MMRQRMTKTACLLAWLAALCAAVPAQAQVEPFAFPTYNTYHIDWGQVWPSSPAGQLLYKGGLGLLVGLECRLTDAVGIGAAIDYVAGSSGTEVVATATGERKRRWTTTAFGGGLSVSFRVAAGPRADVTGFAMVGSYDASHVETFEDEQNHLLLGSVRNEGERRAGFERTVGWLAGVRLGYQLPAGWRVGAMAGYRFLHPEAGVLSTRQNQYINGRPGLSIGTAYQGYETDAFDLSGPTIGLGVSYAF